MEENLKQEALLRSLLSRRNCENDQFVYCFLLGSRLFLSPHQLLTELHRMVTEEKISEFYWNYADKVCSKCRQMQSTGVEVPSKSFHPNGTDFRSPKFLSSAYITDSDSQCKTQEGEDSNRWRKRCRRRNQESETDFVPQTNGSQPRDSCDSGILSAVLEPFFIESSNNNVLKASVFAKQTPPTGNDNGHAVEDSATGCHGCTRRQQKEASAQSKQQLLLVLREWVRHFPADFRNKKTRWTLDDVIRSCQLDNEDVDALCTEVIDCISRQTAAQESYEQQLNELDQTETLRRNMKFRKSKNWMLKFTLKLKHAADVNLVAQQLCLIEMDLLRHVGAEEFLQLFTEDGEDVRTNLGACVRWFNRLSRLVATLVCICRKRKHARHVITFYARVANRCLELSNFNSSMAIMTGLSFGPVTRLKKTWSKLVLSELIRLQSAFDPSNNFLKYRTELMNRVEKLCSPTSVSEEKGTNRFSLISQHSVGSASSSHHGDSGIECDTESPSSGCQSPTPPFKGTIKHFTFNHKSTHDGVMVPFLGLLVKDVYFLNHAIQTTNKDGSINFEKLRHLSNILRPIEEWKKMSSPYQKDDQIQEFLLQAPVQNDTDLYLLSYKRESPANRFEKQQLKTLKSKSETKSEIPQSKIRCKTV